MNVFIISSHILFPSYTSHSKWLIEGSFIISSHSFLNSIARMGLFTVGSENNLKYYILLDVFSDTLKTFSAHINDIK